jgi:hypothetical protein
MLQRLLKWFVSELGSLGKVFLVAIIFLSVGTSFYCGIGGGFLAFGAGLVFYCLIRGIDSVE